MSSQRQTWRIGLGSPPVLYAAWLAVHGHVPVERYRLNGLWCLHVYRYTGEARIGETEHPIRPGYVSLTPPDTDLEHRWLHPGSTHFSFHFALPDGDASGTPILAMQDLGDAAGHVGKQLEDALQFFPACPARAALRVWDVLWQISDLNQEPAAPHLHPAVRKSVAIIESRFHEPIAVGRLAEEVEVSHNHLIRLFQAAFGTSVREYIAQRKLQRAEYLLQYSTLPVKVIAAQVGLPDLQQFNKAIRRSRGRSPRAIRAAERS